MSEAWIAPGRFPGHEAYTMEAKLKDRMVGALTLVMPDGTFLHAPFDIDKAVAVQKNYLKQALHQVVEGVIQAGIGQGVKK